MADLESEEPHWENGAAACALEAVRNLRALELPETTLLNINVPNTAREAAQGSSGTPSRRGSATPIAPIVASTRAVETYIWIWGSHKDTVAEEGTDLAALRDGYAQASRRSRSTAPMK